MNILIVEDSKSICDFLSAVILKHYPFWSISTSCDFNDALAKLEKTHFDLFILDYELDKENPLKNGLSLGKRILELKEYKKTPIVFETNFSEHVLDVTNSLNCIYYLVKPFKEADLLKMLNKISQRDIHEIRLLFHNAFGIQTIINASDIVCIEGSEHNITVVTVYDTYYFINYSLTKLVEDSENMLIRCHKSHVVNAAYITHVDKTNRYLTLTYNHYTKTIPIGRKFANEIYGRIL